MTKEILLPRKKLTSNLNVQNRSRIIFSGSSNVGKSSIIRLITGINVRVGKTPGSTVSISEYPWGNSLIVDLPGFGYMRRKSREFQEINKDTIISYLERNKDTVCLAIIILSLPIFPEIFDRWERRNMVTIPIEFATLYEELGIPYIVVANKIDKMKLEARNSAYQLLKSAYLSALDPTEDPPNILLSSVKTGEGINKIKQEILNQITNCRK